MLRVCGVKVALQLQLLVFYVIYVEDSNPSLMVNSGMVFMLYVNVYVL